ncbi:helix-turn-helix domain-containing protein, partial [Rhizobium ruizarguesonis]
RLHYEGQSYAAIKDDIRRDLAVELLLNTSMTIGEIAVQLGYSEPSSFFRAFRKWVGNSPEGSKQFITSGKNGDIIIVFAVTDPDV